MSAKPVLKLDWCSHAAAKYAVEHWHYSKAMPVGKLAKVGMWEDNSFRGVVIFGFGNIYIGHPYGLTNFQACELKRVALSTHASPVSQVLSIALRLLRRAFSGLRLVVSFADPLQGHNGAVYQASNWLYCGLSAPTGGREYYVRGQWIHTRTLGAKFGTRAVGVLNRLMPGVPTRLKPRRYKYLYPLDAAMRIQITPLAQPYPKRATSILADAPTDQAGESGAAPTVALAAVEG
jgi:hypothetical protein